MTVTNPEKGETVRTLLTITLLAAAVLPALSQAQTINICDRTQGVRTVIMWALKTDDCAAVDSGGLARILVLDFNDLTSRLKPTTLQAGDFAGLTNLQRLLLDNNRYLTALPEGLFDGLTSLQELKLDDNRLAELPAGLFDGLTSLQILWLHDNQLTELPAGLFDGLTSLQKLDLAYNHLEELPNGLFDGLTSLQTLLLYGNQLATLPEGVFDSLTSLQELYLHRNQLATLPEGVFDGLTNLEVLDLQNNYLVGLTENDPLFAGLPNGVELRLGMQTELFNICDRTPRVRDVILQFLEAYDCAAVALEWVTFLNLSQTQLMILHEGDFDGLTSLRELYLHRNQLTALPAGLFDDLTSLQILWLHDNRLTALPAGLFDGLTSLQELYLRRNQLTALPAGLFDSLTRLRELDLAYNHLVGLTPNDPLFAGIPSVATVSICCQSEPPEPLEPPTNTMRLAAAVPLMISASDSIRQGFVRIINESEESGTVRILAFDDSGAAANPIAIQLGASEAFHFNAGDLENGNARKGINAGVGSPIQGDWRLDVETALAVRVLAFVRTNDGFLTAMHDVLPRDADRRLVAQTFNPRQNDIQVSRLRLVNTGANAESVSIEGVDDQGNTAGPVALTLAAGQSRTLSAYDLETGNAQGLTGMLGDGAGKWRLFITAGQSVVGMSLLRAASSHLTNISAPGVANAERLPAAVPLMLSASDSIRQGFVRIINESEESGSVRILAVDDGGTTANPIEIELDTREAFHFNSDDLENGNVRKGINAGVGSPLQGDWRLNVETALAVQVPAFVRTNDGFLTAMHDTLPRDAEGRLAVYVFNPASNDERVSRLRLANIGANAESVSIEGVDDRGNAAGPVTVTLAAGESRTLSAYDLETGNAQGLTGALGDGAGKWRLFVTAGQSVVGMSLLESASGHLTNLSTMGAP